VATISSRQQQRRRTNTQFVAENPTLAAGELGVTLPETGVQYPGFVVGDGSTAYNSLKAVQFPGTVLTRHDARYAFPSQIQHNGTLISEVAQDVGMPRISCADAATTRLKWVWEVPVEWDAVRVRFGQVNETTATGDVKWQFAYRLIYLGEGDVDAGAMTTISMAAITASGEYDWHYVQPTELASIATPDGGFADKPFMLCALSRLGSDVADTLAGAISVGITTATRIDI